MHESLEHWGDFVREMETKKWAFTKIAGKQVLELSQRNQMRQKIF